jgi:hypothetical protein
MDTPAFNVTIMEYFLQNYSLKQISDLNISHHLRDCVEVAKTCFNHFTSNESIAVSVAIYNFARNPVQPEGIRITTQDLANFFGVSQSSISVCWNRLQISRIYTEAALSHSNSGDEDRKKK